MFTFRFSLSVDFSDQKIYSGAFVSVVFAKYSTLIPDACMFIAAVLLFFPRCSGNGP